MNMFSGEGDKDKCMYIDDASSIKFDPCNSQLRRHICTTTGKESWHIKIYHVSYVSKYNYITDSY